MAVSNWKQRALIKITPQGGTGIDLSVMSKDISVEGGEYDIKSEPNLAGGRMVSFTPATDVELTIDNVQFTTAELDALMLASDGTSKFADRIPVRVVITWVADPTITDAEADTATPAVETYRMTLVDGYVTSFAKKFGSDDGVLTGTLKCKFPIRNIDGTSGNYTVEYSETGLSAVGSY